jgi:NAD+ kinase
VLAREDSPRVKSAWAELREFLNSQAGTEVIAAEVTEKFTFENQTADFVLVLGGDGAILGACRQMGAHQLPILGVNLGRFGFLADLSVQAFRDNFDAIQRRNYFVADHLMFECKHIHADGSSESHLGLNEIAVSSGASQRMIDVTLEIDDEKVTTYSCDGLIVSTPVGSTAHSLSAGGPILRQDLRAFVITPICPHTLTNRPLVDDADCIYRLTVPEAPQGVTLVIDGQVKRPVLPDDRIEVRRADVSFKLVRIPSHSYYATLHRKLGWGGQPRYNDR